jgi:hypothetical protein
VAAERGSSPFPVNVEVAFGCVFTPPRLRSHFCLCREGKRYKQVAEKVSEILRFARQNQKLLEPEAQALLVITLPYLTKKLQRGTF